MFEYSFHVILHLFPHSARDVDKPEQEWGTFWVRVHQTLMDFRS